MSLADALSETQTAAKGPRCTMGRIWQRLDPADRDALTAALDAGMTYPVIQAALNKVGHDVQAGTVSRHFRRVCKCPDDVTG